MACWQSLGLVAVLAVITVYGDYNEHGGLGERFDDYGDNGFDDSGMFLGGGGGGAMIGGSAGFGRGSVIGGRSLGGNFAGRSGMWGGRGISGGIMGGSIGGGFSRSRFSKGFGGMRSGFGGMTSGFGGMTSGFGGINSGFGEMSSGFGGMSSGFGRKRSISVGRPRIMTGGILGGSFGDRRRSRGYGGKRQREGIRRRSFKMY